MLRLQMQMTNVLWQIAIRQVMNLKLISHVHPEQILPPVQMIYQDTRYMVKWGSRLCILKLLWELSEAAECYAPVGQLVYASCVGLHCESQADAFHFAEAMCVNPFQRFRKTHEVLNYIPRASKDVVSERIRNAPTI